MLSYIFSRTYFRNINYCDEIFSTVFLQKRKKFVFVCVFFLLFDTSSQSVDKLYFYPPLLDVINIISAVFKLLDAFPNFTKRHY